MTKKLTSRVTITKGALLGVLVAYVMITVAFLSLVRVQQHYTHLAASNRNAIIFICSTNMALSGIVHAAATQIHTGLNDGAYQRLVVKGVITEKDLLAARSQVKVYDQTYKRLNRDGPCEAVTPKK